MITVWIIHNRKASASSFIRTQLHWELGLLSEFQFFPKGRSFDRVLLIPEQHQQWHNIPRSLKNFDLNTGKLKCVHSTWLSLNTSKHKQACKRNRYQTVFFSSCRMRVLNPPSYRIKSSPVSNFCKEIQLLRFSLLHSVTGSKCK